jgi:hypothetical protein
MLLTETLRLLQGSLAGKAEDAYTKRDHARSPRGHTYAEGEAHAYGIAEAEVRKAQRQAGNATPA